MNCITIIQARYNSSRLPGKVLYKINNKTIIEHLSHRIDKIKNTDKIIFAIPSNKNSDILYKEIKRLGYACYRGSENNVLSRFYKTSLKYKAKYILRLTSDCPFIDPYLCDQIIEKTIKNKLDYVSNNYGKNSNMENLIFTWPHGLDCECFSFKSLKKAYQNCQNNSQKEHVTEYIRISDKFKKSGYKSKNKELRLYRLTLDTKKDFDFTKTLFSKLSKDNFSWQHTIDVINSNKALLKLAIDKDRHKYILNIIKNK